MTPAGGTGTRSALTWYYLATPVFFLMDVVWGVNVRVAALENTPVLKYGYYALCLACGGLTTLRPRLSGAVGVAESSVNILLLILGMLLPYYRMIETLAAGKDFVPAAYTPAMFVNFALSGAVWIAAFYRSEAALHAGRQ